MTPVVKNLPSTKLIGMKVKTSLSDYGAPTLWQRFMPRRKEISNLVDSKNYSVQIYSSVFSYKHFNPTIEFKYWAATEVSEIESIPYGMETLLLPEGKYAVFIHKGPMSTFQKTLEEIHSEWLPNSSFELDHRPHFEVLDERYLGPNNPDSEEEIWIPIR